MRIFGKERETLRVLKTRSSRAVFVSEDIQEVELKLLVEDKKTLTLILRPDEVHRMVTELSLAYEAMRPTLRRGGDYAMWDGMQDY